MSIDHTTTGTRVPTENICAKCQSINQERHIMICVEEVRDDGYKRLTFTCPECGYQYRHTGRLA